MLLNTSFSSQHAAPPSGISVVSMHKIVIARSDSNELELLFEKYAAFSTIDIYDLSRMPPLRQLTRLQRLTVVIDRYGLPDYMDTLPLESLSYFPHCVQALPPSLGRCNTLRELAVSSACISPWFANIASLRSLRISKDMSEQQAVDVSRCTQITKLELVCMSHLPSVLATMSLLDTLVIAHFDGTAVRDMPLPRHELCIEDARKLRILPASFYTLRQLQKLSLVGCASLMLEDLSCMQGLCFVRISNVGTTISQPQNHGADVKVPFTVDGLPSGIRECILQCENNASFGSATHARLEKLTLSHCSWAGDQLPDNVLVAGLTELYLKNMQFTQLPNALASLTLLRILWLHHVGLVAIPNFIGNLPALKELSIKGDVASLPDKLQQLEKFTLTTCSTLPALPDIFSDTLHTLNLEGSRMDLPAWVANSGTERWISLVIPSNVRNCLPTGIIRQGRLAKLDCTSTERLVSLPQGPVCLSALRELDLKWSRKLKVLPEWVGTLPALHTLGVGDCYSLTTLPDGDGFWPSLTSLNFSHSGLVTLPASFADRRDALLLNLEYTSVKFIPARLAELCFVPVRFNGLVARGYYWPRILSLVLAGRRLELSLPLEIWHMIGETYFATIVLKS